MENVIGRGYIILMFMNLKLNNWTASNVEVGRRMHRGMASRSSHKSQRKSHLGEDEEKSNSQPPNQAHWSTKILCSELKIWATAGWPSHGVGTVC